MSSQDSRQEPAAAASTVTRWTRYGKDRLYVSDAGGLKVGWVDLLTDEQHPETPAHAAELAAAVQRWGGPRPSEAPKVPAEVAGEPPATIPTTLAVPTLPAADVPEPLPAAASTAAPQDAHLEQAPEPKWEDLAGRRAGAMAREQAVALKQVAPVRTFFARALGVHTDERAWRIGADGEEKVAAQLAKLAAKDPRWHFLHAVPVGENGSDIDHIVIGPAGVFTLNAKHHPGAKIWVGGNTFMVNGRRQPYVGNSAHEARRTARLLTAACGFAVSAVGVVVPVGADDVVIKSPPTEVHVVYRRALARWLRDQPVVLSDDVLAQIFTAARRSTTWQTPATETVRTPQDRTRVLERP